LHSGQLHLFQKLQAEIRAIASFRWGMIPTIFIAVAVDDEIDLSGQVQSDYPKGKGRDLGRSMETKKKSWNSR